MRGPDSSASDSVFKGKVNEKSGLTVATASVASTTFPSFKALGMSVDTPTLGSASVELKEKYKNVLRKLLTVQRSYLLKVKKQMGDKTAQVR